VCPRWRVTVFYKFRVFRFIPSNSGNKYGQNKMAQ
jgi:hypothetical protein